MKEKVDIKKLKNEDIELYNLVKPYLIIPECIDAICNSDHNWKYKEQNEVRVCKDCGEKQRLRDRGYWY